MIRTILGASILLLASLVVSTNSLTGWNEVHAALKEGEHKTALREIEVAVSEGNARAQYSMGLIYDNYPALDQDNKEAAVYWYTKAAEQGNADAQVNLGIMYISGQGTIQNYVKAHMWWNISAFNGDTGAQEKRDIVEKMMTPSQVKEAQDLARECLAKEYKGC
jgi:TPR repeat protein